MLVNKCSTIFRLGKKTGLCYLRDSCEMINGYGIPHRYLSESRWNKQTQQNASTESTDITPIKPREILQKAFPENFYEGKFISRISYVDFVDQALEKMKDLGLEKDLEAYKELIRVFPPGKYCPQSWDIGLFHAPQQLCCIRLLFQMEKNSVRPDKEVEKLVVEAFSKQSMVWLKTARMLYWSMKGRNVDPNPLPEVLPKKTYELAKISLVRMLEDRKSVVTVTNTSSLPNAVDKTWIVYAQSPVQMDIIDELDEKSILYIEECGLTYVGKNLLTYFSLKIYDDEETIKRREMKPEPDFNYNTLKVQFYGKPIEEKMKELKEIHHTGDGYVLSLCITGTSSQDSLLSWLKLLQRRNPKLKNLNVIFRMSRPTHDVLNPDMDPEVEQEKNKKARG